MFIRVYKNSDELNQEFASWFVMYMQQILSQKEFVTVALTGGKTPKSLYQLLATEQFKTKVDWPKIHFFWGDERFVPFNDPENNANMAYEALLDKLPAGMNVHRFDTNSAPEISARAYEALLHEYFPNSNETFDLVLLGMGDNAHTLSLFPGYKIVNETAKWVDAYYLREQKMFRITLTAPVVNAAKCVAFIVTGAEKAAAVQHVIEGGRAPDKYPAQLIDPQNGDLFWWLDKAAASKLKTSSTIS